MNFSDIATEPGLEAGELATWPAGTEFEPAGVDEDAPSPPELLQDAAVSATATSTATKVLAFLRFITSLRIDTIPFGRSAVLSPLRRDAARSDTVPPDRKPGDPRAIFRIPLERTNSTRKWVSGTVSSEDTARPSWLGLVSVVTLLPAILVVVEATSVRTDVKLLLFPPLAAIGYRIFRQPETDAARLRSVILGPVLGSLCGWGLATIGGLRAWTVAVAVVSGVLIIELAQADAPPILAIVLLALFVGHPDWRYPVAVLAATSLVYITFQAWLWATRSLGPSHQHRE
jgi:hypothetical protein